MAEVSSNTFSGKFGRISDSKCHVCGERATYHFYGAMACDSCRTFFRRYLLKNVPIPCINLNDDCYITIENRKDCPRCRFKKCLEAGMNPHLVSTPETFRDGPYFEPRTPIFSAMVPYLGKRTKSYKRKEKSLIVPTIQRPIVSYIDTQVSGLTNVERGKLSEVLSIITYSHVRPHLANCNCKDKFFDITVSLITKLVAAFKTLKAVEFLDTKILSTMLKGSVSEVVFLRSIPLLDYEEKQWTLKNHPLLDEETKNLMPHSLMSMEVLRLISDELYEEYDALIRGMPANARSDFILMAIVSAITFYDPTRVDSDQRKFVAYEQNVFFRILNKYLISKLGPQKLREVLSERTLPECINQKILDRIHVIKNLYEGWVLIPF